MIFEGDSKIINLPIIDDNVGRIYIIINKCKDDIYLKTSGEMGKYYIDGCLYDVLVGERELYKTWEEAIKENRLFRLKSNDTITLVAYKQNNSSYNNWLIISKTNY